MIRTTIKEAFGKDLGISSSRLLVHLKWATQGSTKRENLIYLAIILQVSFLKGWRE